MRCSTALLVLLLGCAEPGRDANVNAGKSFEAFSRELFTELQARPAAQQRFVEIGLFGDLDVQSGENVVMGRYRYRVDTTGGEKNAYMAFVMREEGRDVPVVLSFNLAHDGWQLDETRSLSRGREDDSLHSRLQRDLEEWASGAVEAVSD